MRGKFAIGTGIGDLHQDSLARLNRLGEFGIELAQILPNCFDVYNSDTWEDKDHYSKLCWGFLPEEESGISENDDWGFLTDHVLMRSDKRENFIVNSDHIEKDFGLILPELNDIYGEAFYKLRSKASSIKLLSIDEVSTCIAYWK